MRKVDFKETSCWADDLSLPFGAAAAVEGDMPGAVDVVSIPEFAVAVTDALLVDGFGAPFPLA